jgi:hypothetical protein
MASQSVALNAAVPTPPTPLSPRSRAVHVGVLARLWRRLLRPRHRAGTPAVCQASVARLLPRLLRLPCAQLCCPTERRRCRHPAAPVCTACRERNDGLYRVVTYLVAKIVEELGIALLNSIAFGERPSFLQLRI